MVGAAWFTRHADEHASGAWNTAPVGDFAAVAETSASHDVERPHQARRAVAGPVQADETGEPTACAHAPRVSGGVTARDPRQSFVLLAAAQRLQSLRLGDRFWRGTIESIGWNATLGTFALVGFADGHRCVLSQFGAAPDDARPPAITTRDPLDAAVDRLGDNRFRVQRAMLLHVFAQPAEMMRTTRAVPIEENGRMTGVRLTGTTPNWMLGRIGIQNGDVLVRVDGRPVESVDQLLEAYARLQTADGVHLGVMRGTVPVQIDYELR